MEPGWIESPKRPLQTEAGENQGVILQRFTGGPDFDQPVRLYKNRVVDDVRFIIPDECAVPGGVLNQKCSQKDRQSRHQPCGPVHVGALVRNQSHNSIVAAVSGGSDITAPNARGLRAPKQARDHG